MTSGALTFLAGLLFPRSGGVKHDLLVLVMTVLGFKLVWFDCEDSLDGKNGWYAKQTALGVTFLLGLIFPEMGRRKHIGLVMVTLLLGLGGKPFARWIHRLATDETPKPTQMPLAA